MATTTKVKKKINERSEEVLVFNKKPVSNPVTNSASISQDIPKKSRLSFFKKISLWRLGFLLLIIVSALWWGIVSVSSMNSWKAVFIDNDQVYFGKGFVIPFSSHMTLRHVYYIQNNTEGQTTVVKPLTDDVHGPHNRLSINRDHILYIQELRKDSPLGQGLTQRHK